MIKKAQPKVYQYRERFRKKELSLADLPKVSPKAVTMPEENDGLIGRGSEVDYENRIADYSI